MLSLLLQVPRLSAPNTLSLLWLVVYGQRKVALRKPDACRQRAYRARKSLALSDSEKPATQPPAKEETHA